MHGHLNVKDIFCTIRNNIYEKTILTKLRDFHYMTLRMLLINTELLHVGSF